MYGRTAHIQHAMRDVPEQGPWTRTVTAPAPASDRMLALQRTAGNAAVARMVGQQRHLARCRGAKAGSCGCYERGAEVEASEGAASRFAAARRALASAALARAPSTPPVAPPPPVHLPVATTRQPYHPNPSWSTKGIANPQDDCTPFSEFEADIKWEILSKSVPLAIVDHCGCLAAGAAYASYLNGTGTPHYVFKEQDGNCVSKQCTKDVVAHEGTRQFEGVEDPFTDGWRSADEGSHLAWQALEGGADVVELDLMSSLSGTPEPVSGPLTQQRVDNQLTYSDNNLAGGLLLGSGNDNDRTKTDSEWGFDTRNISGVVRLERTGDRNLPDRIFFKQTITFFYEVHDALDFCPANTMRQSRGGSVDKHLFNELLPDLSRLEASGMARDIEITVTYHRTRATEERAVDRPVPAPPLPPGPEPVPDPPKPRPKPKPRPGPTGRLTAPVFLEGDGQPNPTLEACYEDRARLQEGTSGEAVRMVQDALIEIGADLGTTGPAGDGVDSAYGPKTAQAVRAFKAQESLGSEQFGDVGPGTMHRLDEILAV